MRRADSFEKTLMLGKIEGQRRRGRQRMSWLDGITDLVDMVWVDSGSWWWTGRPGVLRFVGLQRVRHDWVTELKLWLIETGSPREIWEDILWILKTNGNVCSYPIVFRQICNSRKNQIIGQRWRRVNNELLPVRSLKRPLPGAPDVSSQLVSSLQFYLCWTLASFFCLAAHFPHPQPILCIKLLSKPEAKNWEGTCWQSVGYTASRIYFTSVNIHPYLTSTYWMIFPHHLQKMFCMSSSLSEAVEWKKKLFPPQRTEDYLCWSQPDISQAPILSLQPVMNGC